MKKENEFMFKIKVSNNKFDTDNWDTSDEINVKFRHYNDKITICNIIDGEAYKIYTHFQDLKVFSKKIFKPEIYGNSIIFTGKSICLNEDIYDKRTGEKIALEKAIERRKAFYVMLMDLVIMRLVNIRSEGTYIIESKWLNIWDWDKKIPKDKQLELNWNTNQNYVIGQKVKNDIDKTEVFISKFEGTI